jgi:hypothetical protein
MGDKRKIYELLVRKPKGKKSLGRIRRSCVDNIKMDLGHRECGGMDWIGLAGDREKCSGLGM